MSGRAIVLVRTGLLKGHKAVIPPGRSLRIGRTERADMVFPGDLQMSAVHCELAWDGRSCRLRDLDSLKGTKLGGEPITDTAVEDGAYLQAGDTVLSVYFEGAVAPRRRHRPAEELRAARLSALAALRGEGGVLHGIFDAARDERVLELLPRASDDFQSLYEGVKGEALAEVAPYLVAFQPGSPLLESLVMEGWGDGWGVYLTWPGPLKELRRHLRRFLMVLDGETTQKMYFRYYDPRVLRDFLPSCSPMQIAELFGEIGCFVVEGEKGEVMRFAGSGG